MSSEHEKAISSVILQLERSYGKGIVMKLGCRDKLDIPFIPTGALTLDSALGIGGVPRGRIIEIYGPESSGKTTLSLSIAANCQKLGGCVGFIDAEHALDSSYAKLLGVDIDNLYISQPDNGEQALEIAESFVRSGVMDLIIVDSVAALVPKSEIEGNMGDSHVGLQARLMSQALRKLTALANKTTSTIIFINQIRMKIGVMFGSPETTTGGNALKFYSSVRLDIRRIESLKKGDEIFGNKSRVKVVKNKVAAPFRKAEFDIIFGKGISYLGCLLDVCVDLGVINKSGSWYNFKGDKLGQGRDNSILFLKESKDIVATLDDIVRKKMGIASPTRIRKKS